jgi:hypothetical protein
MDRERTVLQGRGTGRALGRGDGSRELGGHHGWAVKQRELVGANAGGALRTMRKKPAESSAASSSKGENGGPGGGMSAVDPSRGHGAMLGNGGRSPLYWRETGAPWTPGRGAELGKPPVPGPAAGSRKGALRKLEPTSMTAVVGSFCRGVRLGASREEDEQALAAAARGRRSKGAPRHGCWERPEKISGRHEQRGSVVCVWERKKKVVAAREKWRVGVKNCQVQERGTSIYRHEVGLGFF